MKKKTGIELGLAVFSFIVVAMLLVWNAGGPIEEITMPKRFEKPVALGYADPGSGASGIMRAGIVKSGVTWTSNLSDSDWYEYTETNNTDCGSDVPYETNFYVAYLVRWNRTHAFNDTSDTYEHDWVEGWLNCTDLSISSQAMTEANITGCNTDEFIWMHYYAGPYTISRGESISDVIANWNAYYS